VQVERLVCGNPNLDFDALERNAKYEGGFSVSTSAVQWLWQVGGSLNNRTIINCHQFSRAMQWLGHNNSM